MNLGSPSLRRRVQRLGAILSAFAVLMSMMVFFAPTALAHHPEVTAFQTCLDQKLVIHYDAVSWKTDGTSGSGHPDIKIEVRVNGVGSWSEMGAGAFTSGNFFRFSGDIDASPYMGQSIEVQARSVGPWDNGVAGGQTFVTDPIVVDLDCNQTPPGDCEEDQQQGFSTLSSIPDNDPCEPPPGDCEENQQEGFSTLSSIPDNDPCEPPPSDCEENQQEDFLTQSGSGHDEHDRCEASVVVTDGDCDPLDGVLGSVEVVIDPDGGAVVTVYSDEEMENEVAFFDGVGGSEDLAPGTYYWEAEAEKGFKLKGEDDGEFTIAPCDVEVLVANAACLVDDGPVGSVTVSIEAANGATVTVYDDALGVAASFGGGGGTRDLAPGHYIWLADPSDGFEFPEGEESSGAFTIYPCGAAVVVTHGDCDTGAVTAAGSVRVRIDPASAATVTVLDSQNVKDAVFSGAGGEQALPVDTYTWGAIPAPGFELADPETGGFQVLACDEVEAVEVLPFTGIDSEKLLGGAIVLLGVGISLIHIARRGQEG